MDTAGAMGHGGVFGGEHRRWWTLGAVSLGLFMIMLDNTVVNVALPSMQQSLGLSLSELEWVVAGYALTFAALMLTGGKLADLLGRRRVYVAGLVVFTAASLACGLAGSAEVLIGARVVQGIGAAMMNPATLSIITATFPPRQRGTAIGIWAGVSALALAIGPLVGGLLSEHVDWSWIFFVNVPVGIVAIAAAYAFVDESRDTSHDQRPDVPGLVTSGVGLFALTYALIEANSHGWGSTRILGAFALAAVSLAAFVVLELRQRRPMLDLTLFRNATFSGANVSMLLVALAMFGVFFYVSLYLQQILGYSPVEAGASFLPATILIAVLAPQVGRVVDRVGSRWLTGSGMLLLSLSLVLFARLGTSSTYWEILPGLVAMGVGMALTMTPTTAAAMGSVPRDQAGVGSAVLNSMRQVGGSLGIAVTGAIVAHVSSSSLAAGHTRPEAFMDGFQRGLEVAAVIAVAGSVVAVVTMRGHRQQLQTSTEEPAFQEAA
ncbi:MAG TPA: MFS transporter [Gaiella sp.]|uniref:MFS transporter n=1 Tax=Gaiella sp. TaxID=2663207 RepID=UPI002D7EF6A4|nr:MFS transporter [Gaiella sp.]HET9287687.1 MFS transporter [Gaiella sp.]